MAREQTFEQKLQPHVGGLVRVRCDDGYANSLNGKIGLLMSASEGRAAPTALRAGREAPMQIEVLIDGSVRILLLYPQEIELIGADDV